MRPILDGAINSTLSSCRLSWQVLSIDTIAVRRPLGEVTWNVLADSCRQLTSIINPNRRLLIAICVFMFVWHLYDIAKIVSFLLMQIKSMKKDAMCGTMVFLCVGCSYFIPLRLSAC